jgi:adenylosuccinate synthase
LEEVELGKKSIGTTGKGIGQSNVSLNMRDIKLGFSAPIIFRIWHILIRFLGPTYSTKAARSGIRVSEIFNESLFEDKIRELARAAKKRWGDLLTYDVEEEISRFKQYRTDLANYVTDAVVFMDDVQKRDVLMLVEGANALMLDIDYGT